MSKKVCPDCGAQAVNSEADCAYCGTRLVRPRDLPKDIWKDPAVKEALTDGRQSWDIAVLRCPKCNQFGYYNEGSTFSCRFCGDTYRVDEELAGEVVSLSDTVTETTDGYYNQTA